MKVFISQSMRDAPGEVEKERMRVIRWLEDHYTDIEIIQPYFETYDPSGGCAELKRLAKRIETMADADLVYFSHTWTNDSRCEIERKCATQYDIPIVITENEYPNYEWNESRIVRAIAEIKDRRKMPPPAPQLVTRDVSVQDSSGGC